MRLGLTDPQVAPEEEM